MLMLTLFALLVVVGLIKYFMHMRHMESYVKHLPTMDPIYPFIGSAHHFIGKSTAELFDGIVKFVNDVETPAKAYIGPVLNITLDKPEDIRTILMSQTCLDKPYMYRFLPSTVGILTTECNMNTIPFKIMKLFKVNEQFDGGHGLQFDRHMNSGAFWKPIRKLLNPTFNLKILQSFVPIFNNKTKIMLENLDKEAGNPNFDLSKYMHACTLDMVCATTMGFNVDVQRDKNMDFLKSIEAMCEIVGKRFIRPWAHSDFVYRFTDLYQVQQKHCNNINILTSRIRDMKRDEYFDRNKHKIGEKSISEDSEESYKTPQVLIDQLFRLFFSGHFSEQVVKEQIETVLIAGNETSALTLSYTILLLAMYPDIQERLYSELRSVYDTQDEETSYERVQQLPYLDLVLKEGMRMFPVAPFIVRTATADTPVSSCIIPKNSIIMMSIFNLHRRKDVWGEDAEEFNPDHFLPEQINQRHPFCFLPFSGGPRNCIGYIYAMISMKVILAGILRKYKFTTSLKLSDLQMKFELTLKLANKHMVGMERREW